MNNIKTLFGLEQKLNRRPGSKTKNLVLSFVYALLTIAVLGVVSYYAIIALAIVGGGDFVGLISFVVLTLMVVLFFYTIANQLKVLFLYKDKTTLAFIPVSKWQIYLAKSLTCLMNIYIFNFIVSTPVLAAFGIVFSMPISYYLIGLLCVVLLPLLPYGLASLFVIPLMFAYNWLKNKNTLKLIISVILTIVGFYFYMKIVFNVATLTLIQDVPTKNLMEVVIKFCSSIFVPSTWFAHLLCGQYVMFSILAVLLFAFLTVGLGCVIGLVSYKSIFNEALTMKNFSKQIKTKSKVRNVFWSYFVTEIKDLFRNSNYAFTYFGMAIAMPVMVWSCNKFVLDFASEKLGSNIVFGTTLLVVFIFVSIICSPTASFISKEGDNFWILKTNPKGITLPLFAKSLIGILSSFASVAISIVAICLSKFIPWSYGLIILGLTVVYIVGLVSFGLILNLYRPNIFYLNIENNSNMLIHMLVSLIVSLLAGIASIILSFSFTLLNISLICLAIVFVFTLTNFILLLTQHKKLYAKMER